MDHNRSKERAPGYMTISIHTNVTSRLEVHHTFCFLDASCTEYDIEKRFAREIVRGRIIETFGPTDQWNDIR